MPLAHACFDAEQKKSANRGFDDEHTERKRRRRGGIEHGNVGVDRWYAVTVL